MRARRYTPSVAETHRRWLELVDTDGPFLAVPPLKDVWPQGVPAVSSDAKAVLAEVKPAFEKAWEAWDRHRDDDAALPPYRTARDAWVATILRDVVGWGDLFTTDLAGTPADVTATSLDRTVPVTATGALVHGGTGYALVLTMDPVESLRDPLEDGWAASPIDRMEALLRAASVPIGVVTDGRWWALVCTQDGAMTASGVVDSQTWIEEPDVRDAFLTLLSRQRLIGGLPVHRLPALFTASVAAAEEITEALGVQVRRAVELLVSAFSETAEDARRRGEPDPLPADRDLVYQAAVTVMMRAVFLLFAEERSLLPHGELFTMGYGITGQLDDLDERQRLEGAESLDATHLTWHRLLATSNALYGGATFEDIRLPAYGGSLFDPDRFGFLLARREQGTLRVRVSDRVMLEVLRSVQEAQLKGQPARRISFRDVDVEQIGYIYEGLLGYSCTDVDEVQVGLIGADGAEPEIPLNVLAEIADAHPTDAGIADAILTWVKEHQPGAKPPTKAALTKALAAGDTLEDADLALLAVTRDPTLREELHSWIGIIRRDLRGRPVVIQPGGLLVIETPSRQTAGAHYTPRSLAEDVVEHALEPLVYQPGPHQTADRTRWRLLSSDDLLDLNVADIACGSGAFLVAAARYLAARLVEAWHAERVAFGAPHELQTRAIRQVVATCLYGADINEMAVEMCKLSLWLVSLDAGLPFSFVDDRILHGNSLLGLTSAQQLEAMHIDPESASPARSLFDLDVEDVLHRAVRLRERLATEVDDTDPQRSAATKRRQWAEYQSLTAQLSTIADGVIAAGLQLGGRPGKALDSAYDRLRVAVTDAYPARGGQPKPEVLQQIIDKGLTPTVPTDFERWRPLHWALAVPDVIQDGGFDAVVGNPPFLAGKKISTAHGKNIESWTKIDLNGRVGAADISAHFVRRAWSLLREGGCLGLIVTDRVGQGATAEMSTRVLNSQGMIYRAVSKFSWPGKASTDAACVWAVKAYQQRPAIGAVLDGSMVERIGQSLRDSSEVDLSTARRIPMPFLAGTGVQTYGDGFTLDKDAPILRDLNDAERNALRPFVNGKSLMSGEPSGRLVIDAGSFDTEEELLAAMPTLGAHLRLTVKPIRDAITSQIHERRYWAFWDKRERLIRATGQLGQFIVVARDTRVPVFLLTSDHRSLYSYKVAIIASDSVALAGLLSSVVHTSWFEELRTGRGTTSSYVVSRILWTFPLPDLRDPELRTASIRFFEARERALGIVVSPTKLYNMLDNPTVRDPMIDELREAQIGLDIASCRSYRWGNVDLSHGYEDLADVRRFTVPLFQRREIRARLLAENHRQATLPVDERLVADADEVEGE